MKKNTASKKKFYAEGGRVLGSGMAGRAEGALKGRAGRLEAALADAEGSSRKPAVGGKLTRHIGKKAPTKR